MGSESNDKILRRKAEVGRKEYQARAMSVQRALRLSLAKVADTLLDMAMSAIGVTQTLTDAEKLDQHVDENDLLILLDGPDRKRGAAVLDRQLVDGLIQQQTMGTVIKTAQSDPRPMTATDAALCAPLLDALIERAAPLPEKAEERDLMAGYRFGARAEDLRLLLMALEAPKYQVLALTIDIAGGRRQGRLVLILPDTQVAASHPAPSDDPDEHAPGPATPGRCLGEVVMTVEADLMVALGQLQLPYSRISTLSPGDSIPLPDASFDRALVMTSTGRKVSAGALGQVSGMRALRIDAAGSNPDRPLRRASDRGGLDQPLVMPLGPTAMDGVIDMAEVPATGSRDKPITTDPVMPDMSDLPGLDSPEATLSGLPDLPDMSDLPEIAGLPPMPDMDDGTAA